VTTSSIIVNDHAGCVVAIGFLVAAVLLVVLLLFSLLLFLFVLLLIIFFGAVFDRELEELIDDTVGHIVVHRVRACLGAVRPHSVRRDHRVRSA
jgi:hypothetical protein